MAGASVSTAWTESARRHPGLPALAAEQGSRARTDLFGGLLAAPVAGPPQLQGGHQAGEEEADSQDAEDAGEAVQLEGPAVGLGAGVAGEVAAACARPPLLLQHIQVPGVLQLQDSTRQDGRT